MVSHTTPANSSIRKLRVLLIPFFATSHIQPFTELAIRLSAANDAVEATVAVTPANVSIVRSLLDHAGQHNVKVATYPFPRVDGIPEGTENLGKAATPEESLRIRVASVSEPVMRPAQETLIRAHSPGAIVNDVLFFWNGRVADELGVPCVVLSPIGAFPQLAMRHLKEVVSMDDNDNDDDAVVQVPRFPAPPIRIPRRELPEFLRRRELSDSDSFDSHQADCFGLAMNTCSELEKQYCEIFMREGYVKRAYFVGPLALAPAPEAAGIMDWLDSKPNRSVVYISFGSMAQMKDAQLDELALGLETSGQSFVWVVRGKGWTPPAGWEERVQHKHRGLIITDWAPQTAILGHPAVGAFVTHCGWNSVLETVAGGVPMLTWPLVYEQFINERLVTDVLGIGQRLWPDGAGRRRSGRHDEHGVIPGQDVARALTTFMSPGPGGPGEIARSRVMDLAAKAQASMARGGSSYSDLHRLVDDLMAAAQAKRT